MKPTNYARQMVLEATGAITPQKVTRAASRRICRTCGAPTLRGLDGDILAFDVTVDPTPLDPIGELLALTQARRTFDAITVAGRIELEPRDPAHINRPRRYPVLAQHRCHQPLPGPTPNPANNVGQETNDEPPF